MKYAADFRASAREALRGRWGIAVLAGLLASILGGVISRGPELTFSYDDYGLNANLRLLGQTVYSWGGNSSPVFGALLAGGVFYLLLVGLVLAALFFTLGSVVGVGYARFNLNLLDGERPAVETLFAYFLLEDHRPDPAAPDPLCPPLVAAADRSRHHGGLQLCHDGVPAGG